MRQLFLALFVLGLFTGINAQNTPVFWLPVAPDDVVLPVGSYRAFEPYTYQAYRLDYDALVKNLAQAPMEFTAKAKKPVVVLLPVGSGQLEQFALVESPVMMPKLQERHPETRTFSGYSLQTPNKRIRCSYSPSWGFKAIVLRPDKGVEYIEPLAREQNEYYMVYDRHAFPNELRLKGKTTAELPEKISVEAETPRVSLPPARPADRGSELGGPVVVKEYRFAAACTGEFSQDNGGTLQKVLDKVVDVTNKLNAIYERDLDIRLKLVDDEEKIIFLDPTTDPYTGTDVGGWLNQNPTAMGTNLGSADKYDIGHVFARYMGGPAIGVGFLGSCCTILKGRGCSSGNKPYEDDFFSVIGQEIGHQWNGGHTWANCSPINNAGYTAGSACEPGGGTTIMAYSGVCGPDNVQNGFGDLYYNVCSIIEIRSFVEIGEGATCGADITTDNTAPIVTLPYANNFFIPISTPFELTGSAVDPDGDPLTYCWEGIDVGPLAPLGSPVGSTAIFRSYPPTSIPTRTFPKMQTIISTQADKRELLPSYTRDLTFALTARDDRAGGGGVGIDTVRFKATDLAGPFAVTSPSGSFAFWNKGEYKIVTWDVANTDKAPVNCKKVNIKLSLDAGYTYPITLAANVANTGRYCIKVPEIESTTARVRVEAADNVFFDISNSNFKIQAPSIPGFTFCPSDLYDTICLPAQFSTVISTNSSLGFSEPITLTAQGLPAGVTATFLPNPVMPGSDAVLTLEVPANQPEGAFDLIISGDVNGNVDTFLTNLSVFFNDFTGLSVAGPTDGAVGQDQAPTLSWNAVANANTYEVQVADNPSFSAGAMLVAKDNIAGNSYKIPFLLEKGQVFYWRFRAKNECGAGDWLGPFVFATLVDACAVFQSNDVPKNITASQVVTVESKINVPTGGIVSDVNITTIQGNHEFFKDLEMHLISPAGTDVLLFKDKCPNFNGNFNLGFDDSKPGLFGCPPPNNGATSKPTEALNTFNGQNAGGQWLLRVKDNAISSGGKISAFALELCSSTALNPPVLVQNNILQVAPGNNGAVTPDLLKTEDANNSDDELLYTLMTTPKHGELHLNGAGTKMVVGNHFTQTDLNNGGLRYFDYGTDNTPDEFCFTVTDGEGGLIKDCFSIQLFPVKTQELARALRFLLAPNPATETVWISFGEPLHSNTRIRLFDISGRLLRSLELAAGQVAGMLNIADLPEGVYTVSADSTSGTGVRKVVVR